MSNTDYTRRGFIKNMGALGGVGVLLGASGSLLSGCSSSYTSRQSYIRDIIKPKNISPVFAWTDIMLQAVRNQSITPPPASRAFAMAQTAGFLAINGIEGGYNTPYQIQKGPKDADPEIAYGVAFSMALSEALQSSFIFDRKRFLDQYPNNDAKAQAITYGRYAANIVIKDRINDGAEPNKSHFYLGRYPRRDDALKWAPTGPFYGAEDGPFLGTFNRGHLPGWGAQKSWVMKHKGDFRADEFMDLDSPEFLRQLKRIKDIGAANSKSRTKDETEIAFFWEDGPRGATPPGHFQIIAMSAIQDMNLPLIEQARLFALLSNGQADAAITTWDSKYTHDIVRPETVIRHRAQKMGHRNIINERQKNWRSLIFTPDFPAYTSGHSVFGAVSARIITNFIGTDNVTFSKKAPDLVNWPKQLTDVTRSWTSLWQAAEENGMSRIYGGVHWDADNIEGLAIGKRLADYVCKNAFQKMG